MKYLFSILFIFLINQNFIITLNNEKNNLIHLNFISKNTYDNENIQKKNLIIGAIANYNWDKVEIYFKSFQKVGFKNCDCIMFVSNISKKTIDKIKSCGVIVYPISKQYQKESIINVRWKVYEDYLNENQDKYKLVFTADIGDVFYQRDLFELYDLQKSFLGIAIEDGILAKGINSKWMIDAYGEKLFEEIKNERIFCVGSVWGTIDKFVEFSKAMWDRLRSNPKWGIEQAVGNFIIYHDKMFDDCLIKSNNTDGYIMTIGSTKRENIILNLEYNVFNLKGEIAAVVHQYDRHKDLTKLIESKFCTKNDKKFMILSSILIIIFIIIIILIIFRFNRHNRTFNNNSFEIDDAKVEMIKIPKEKNYLENEDINDNEKMIKEG